MRVFIGVGSNLEPRRKNIISAIGELGSVCCVEKISPVYETSALLPSEAPESWNQPFLNLVVCVEYSGTPPSLLKHLKAIEKKLGSRHTQRWSPRVIDLDILFFGGQRFFSFELKVPHPEIEKRAFVMDPLKDILPSFIPRARQHKNHAPLWMAIINLTPDSFSDGGEWTEEHLFEALLEYEEMGVAILDFGAESTRPGAKSLSFDEERVRLRSILESFFDRYGKTPLRPLVSVDTRHVKTAEMSLKMGVDIINDVSGLENAEMLSLIKDSEAAYVLTHSLDVPVDPKNVLKGDPLPVLRSWLDEKLEVFDKNNISFDRVFFDPGIGFGKSALQSLRILKNIRFFESCPVRLLVGHSRKSFMRSFSPQEARLRDLETLGISMHLIHQGVDVLRVHRPEMHIRAFRGWSHVAS